MRGISLASAALLAGLSVASAQASVVTHLTNPTDVVLVDNAYNGTLASMQSSTINVAAGLGAIELVTLSVTMNLGWVGDLSIKLVSPGGTQLHLLSRPGLPESADDGAECCGNSANLVNTIITFADAAGTSAETLGNGLISSATIPDGSYVPSGFSGNPSALANLIGQVPTGDWRLYVGDAGALDTGTLLQWDLFLTTADTGVPEPASLGLFGLGIAGLAALRRRRRDAA